MTIRQYQKPHSRQYLRPRILTQPIVNPTASALPGRTKTSVRSGSPEPVWGGSSRPTQVIGPPRNASGSLMPSSLTTCVTSSPGLRWRFVRAPINTWRNCSSSSTSRTGSAGESFVFIASSIEQFCPYVVCAHGARSAALVSDGNSLRMLQDLGANCTGWRTTVNRHAGCYRIGTGRRGKSFRLKRPGCAAKRAGFSLF